MTVTVRSLLVMLVTVLVTTLTSFRAVADDPPVGSSTPAAIPSAAPAAAPLAPSAPAPRQWLAQPQGGTTETLQAPKSSWRNYAIVLFTLALGGGALYLRLHRQKKTIANASPALRVVSTVRIGPKAHLVMAQVGKKTLLLGVTDSAVQRVAWLDSDSLQEEAEGEQEVEPSAPIRSKPAVQIPQGALEQQPAFNNVLRNLMKVTQSRAQEMEQDPDDAAIQIARSTKDSFEDSAPRSRANKAQPNRRGLNAPTQESPTPSDDFEDQVSGLARRQPRRRG